MLNTFLVSQGFGGKVGVEELTLRVSVNSDDISALAGEMSIGGGDVSSELEEALNRDIASSFSTNTMVVEFAQ